MASKQKIKIGLDANTVIYLSKLNDPKFDPTGIVKDLLDKRALDTRVFASTRRKDLPPILKDNYLGETIELPSGIEIYGNLKNIHQLLTAIKSGEIEAYVSPTVKYECEGGVKQVEKFIEDYLHEIVVDDKDAPIFYTKRMELATKYGEANAIDNERDGVSLQERVTADACITAEYALCGLNFVTANLKHLVHVNVDDEDYKRNGKIKQVNYNYGLIYTTRDGYKRSPEAYSISMFVSKLRKWNKDHTTFLCDFVDVNIDDKDVFTL
ncbi:MAG: hypothetical protein IJ358_02590 [Clostridia bacterium]|nr:hypothetical protein [Clostridia bacterium]